MAKVRARLDVDGTVSERRSADTWKQIEPRTDWSRVDVTTEAEIASQAAEDHAEAARDAAAWVRRVRRRAGLSQAEFAGRIGVSVAAVRNWERGKLFPQGTARALLRVIDRMPEECLPYEGAPMKSRP
jgi:putative transcriptional regulator